MHDNLRSVARDIFGRVLSRCDVESAFDRHLSFDRGVLRIGGDLYDFASYREVRAVAIGKAAHTMTEALVRRTGAGRVRGVVVSPVEPAHFVPGFEYFRGGHPLPNADSVRGARAALRAVSSATAESLVIYLISGGGSAACELPIDDEILLDDLVATNRALVHCGAPIAKINAVRKHLSRIKGGRLAAAAPVEARQVSIFVSDVPGEALDSLASGPTLPDSTTISDCMEVERDYGLLPQLPPSVRDLFERGLLEETPKADDPSFVNSRWWTVLSNETAVEAAAEAARAAGFNVAIDNSCDDWDYAAAADYLLARLRELRQQLGRVCLISGGEVTVKVTGGGGKGGRNQQFALYVAQKIAGEPIAVLSGGTDGIDGNSPAAGAVADGSTVARAVMAGLNVAEALASFNAFPLLRELGDAIVTGPTGNNLRDLRILLAE